ncbi:MAG TPA: quinol:electron acceptor oxidoreductase subunit ActD [Bryobacteraceae bacterium]|nr:quinol:electron acceptor oxidoreductase subunit ActD [Bryobacteraceae bacterium]
MAGKNTAVFGIYRDRKMVEEAVAQLRTASYRNTDISVLFPDNQGTKDFAHEKNTKAPEGATAGGVAGGITGGVLGWLTGIGLLAIPGLGPFVAAGPIVAALAGAGAVGTLGGIIGALAGMGIPEYEAKRFEGRIREGGILLSVHCDSDEWVKQARHILEETGAQDIASAGEKTGDFANMDRPKPRVRAAGSVTPLREETPAERAARRRAETGIDDPDDL